MPACEAIWGQVEAAVLVDGIRQARGGRCFCDDDGRCPFLPDLRVAAPPVTNLLARRVIVGRARTPMAATERAFSFVPAAWA